jgi:DNA invertase Pin-like site-specific DNA recombinase
MVGQQVGYIRVSTYSQNTDRQLDRVHLDRTFTDKASGKDVKRPELEACLKHLREADVLHVHSMDRLARNLDDLRRIVKDLTSQGVVVQFHKEGLKFTGDDSPMSQLLLSIMGAVADFERSLILERQREGIAIAKNKGVYKGRKLSLTQEQVKELIGKIQEGAKVTAIAKHFGISRETVYQYKNRSDMNH